MTSSGRGEVREFPSHSLKAGTLFGLDSRKRRPPEVFRSFLFYSHFLAEQLKESKTKPNLQTVEKVFLGSMRERGLILYLYSLLLLPLSLPCFWFFYFYFLCSTVFLFNFPWEDLYSLPGNFSFQIDLCSQVACNEHQRAFTFFPQSNLWSVVGAGVQRWMVETAVPAWQSSPSTREREAMHSVRSVLSSM